MFNGTSALHLRSVARLHIDAIVGSGFVLSAEDKFFRWGRAPVARVMIMTRHWVARPTKTAARQRLAEGRRHARRSGRQSLDLDLDASASGLGEHPVGHGPRLASSSSARGSTPGSGSASKQYRTVDGLRLSASTADMERLLG
jgi:hypothetical protein